MEQGLTFLKEKRGSFRKAKEREPKDLKKKSKTSEQMTLEGRKNFRKKDPPKVLPKSGFLDAIVMGCQKSLHR